MDKISELISQAKTIVVLQADNPDGDSLSSALLLENILENQGKNVHLYCGVEIPGYLKYLSGWDRVSADLPTKFDLSIIVDSPNFTLFESLVKKNQSSWVSSKPVIVLDHHASDMEYNFSVESFTPKAVSTSEVIYYLAKELSYSLDKQAYEFIASGILSDSLGLTTEEVSSQAVKIIAEAIDNGVTLAKLDTARKELSKKSRRILAYKGELLKRISYELEGRIALITIPWEEIEKYSHEYNPPMLVLDEMRQVEGVEMAIAFKTYPDGRITAKIRSNSGAPVASDLAEYFGGGGHKYASGFRITDGRRLEQIKQEVLNRLEEIL